MTQAYPWAPQQAPQQPQQPVPPQHQQWQPAAPPQQPQNGAQQWQGGPPPNGAQPQMDAPQTQGDAAGFFSTSKSLSFNVLKNPACMGVWRGGQIISPPAREQCRKWMADGSTGPLDYWDEEKTQAKYQLKVLLATSERDGTDQADAGHRTLYVKEGTDLFRKLKALPTSVRMAASDWLWVNFYGVDPASKNPSNPAKLFEVVHAIRPGDYGYGQPPTHAPSGGAQQQFAGQPPAQQAQQPWAQPAGPAPTPANPWGGQPQAPAPAGPQQQPAWAQQPQPVAAQAGPAAGPQPWQQQQAPPATQPWQQAPVQNGAQNGQQPPPWAQSQN